jgi:hypothetical protein
MAVPAHRFTTHGDDVPMTIPVPRFPGMQWPGNDDVAQVPVALILAGRGRCSCQSCCEGFVHMLRRVRLRPV